MKVTVSLYLAFFELIYIALLLLFSKKNRTNILIIGTLTLLFGYQLFEYLICGVGLDDQWFIYFALIDITFLPPLGLLSVLTYLDNKNKLRYLIFLPAIFFTAYFPIAIEELAATSCTVLYATYNYPLGFLYGICYYLPILLSIILLFRKYHEEKKLKSNEPTLYLLLGYVLTFIPGLFIALISYEYVQSAESFLCKQAFLLATFSAVFVKKNIKD